EYPAARSSPRAVECRRMPATATPEDESVEIRNSPWKDDGRLPRPGIVLRSALKTPDPETAAEVLPSTVPSRPVSSRFTIATLVDAFAMATPLWIPEFWSASTYSRSADAAVVTGMLTSVMRTGPAL